MAQEQKPTLAETPPMGWNSWDGYGTTINEEQFKANAKWFAEHLKSVRLGIRHDRHGMVRDQSDSPKEIRRLRCMRWMRMGAIFRTRSDFLLRRAEWVQSLSVTMFIRWD